MFKEMDKTLKDKEQLVNELIEEGIIKPSKRKLMERVFQGNYIKGIEDAFKYIREQIK